jgi:3-hydroxyacyl-CoA dehydrogenase
MSNYQDKLVWKNSSCRLYDIGDDVLGSAMVTKMNPLGVMY